MNEFSPKSKRANTINILNAFSNGFRRSGSEIKMALVIYVLNLLLAIPLALAFRSALAAGFGMSLAPEQLIDRKSVV